MAKKRSNGTGMGVLAVFGVVALIAGLAALVVVRAKNKPQTFVVKGAVTPTHAPLKTSQPVTKRGLDFGKSGDPLLADVDGDRVDELIVYEGRGYAAVNTRTDSVVWRTAPIAPPSAVDSSHFAWVAGKSFVVSRGLDVSVYSLERGGLNATFRLPSPVTRPCASTAPVLARVSLTTGDLDLMPNNLRTKATGECLPVDTDGFNIAARGTANGRAEACNEGRPECRKRLPTSVLPTGFAPLEAQWIGRDVTVFGLLAGEGTLVGVDADRSTWITTLVTPTPPPGLRSRGSGAVANDPAFIGWQASTDQVLVFRSYFSTSGRTAYHTSIEGLDRTTGDRAYLTYLDAAVSGVRYKDPIWVVMTPTSAWELGRMGNTRLLTGSD